MPILLVPGLGGSPRIYAPVEPALWRYGPVTVANHIRDDNMGAIARRILAEAPQRFALAGHSMAEGIHGAKLAILPACGHLPQVEQTEATADALVEWLRN